MEYLAGLRANLSDPKAIYNRKKSLMDGKHIQTLDDVIRELHGAFDSDHVNIEHVHDILLAYRSNPREWKKYAKFDRHRYTRNLVDEGNGKFNLMVLAWSEGQGSGIHDHADSHCFMKVLSGCLREIRFAWPQESEDGDENEMIPIGETELKTNDVAYINDSLGLHRMENKSHSDTAVSLHLYCPPFETVQLFDQRTGHKSKGKVTFWSRYGERTPFVSQSIILKPEDYENN